MTESPSSGDPRAALSARIRSDEFIDRVQTGIIVYDADGVAFRWNQAATKLLGLTPEEWKDHRPFDMPFSAVGDDGCALRADQFPSAIVLRTGQPCLDVIIGVNVPGRRRRWMSMDGYPLFIGGETKGATVWFDEVTDLHREHQSLRLINQVNRFVISPKKGVDPLQSVCDALVKDGAYPLAWIGIETSEVSGAIDIAYAAGATEYLRDMTVSSNESDANGRGPVGTALRSGMSQVAGDLASHSFFGPWRERAASLNLRSCVAIPFAPGGKKAILCVYANFEYAFDAAVVTSKEAIAREIEFAVSQLRTRNQLEESLNGTLLSLGALTETRDPYTAGHQTRVGSLGAAIAERLGLDAKMVMLVRQAGGVHDVGKIAIPAEILTRPGRLTALEFEMIKSHTTVGYEILVKASLPWPIADVALSHHERLDGSGYPAGLVDQDIILPARIIAVADVVEAIAHFRPYRPALGIDAGLVEVIKGAGRLFDRDVVESCRAVFESGFNFESIAATDVRTFS
ncbi:MAG: HD domain-containing protein [Actinomycetota bacterium]|nr:HD domain-containing protein [Actinomycetota bacterium]